MSAERAQQLTRLQLVCATLAQGRLIDHSSLALTLLALGLSLWLKHDACLQVALLGAVLFGAIEKIYALRVAFDQQIFAIWREQWPNHDADSAEVLLAAFDKALADTGLGQPANAWRPLESRIAGAIGLIKTQALLLLGQFALLLAAAAQHYFVA